MGLTYKLGRAVGRRWKMTRWLGTELFGSKNARHRAESKIGMVIADDLLSKMPVFQNDSYSNYLSAMGQYLQQFVTVKEHSITILPLATRIPNAFAVPGGNVFVTRGLLELTQWERDEIAFVVGHEIGHIVLKHASMKLKANAMKRAFRVMCAPLGIASRAMAPVIDAFITSEYSQDREFEADAYALDLLRAARMDPNAGVRFLLRLDGAVKSHQSNLLGDFFSTHPSTTERIQRLSDRQQRW